MKGSFVSKEVFWRGVGWMGLSKVITQSGTWIATIIIARLLTPADYGLVGMSGLLVGIITLVGDFGLNSSIIQKESVSHKEISALFWQYIIIGSLLSCLIFALGPLGSIFWNEPELSNLIRLSSLVYFISNLGQIPSALIQKEMQFREYGIILSISAISGSLVSIFCAYKEMGPYSLIYGSLAVVIVKLLLTYFFKPFWPELVLFTVETKKHLKFGATITLERYLWWYYSNCDFWLASKFLGKDLYGSYSMAFNLASLPLEKIASIVNPVIYPIFSRTTDHNERLNLYYVISKYIAYISFPIFITFFWIADDLIYAILGNKWDDSILIFKIFVILFPLRCLASITSPYLNSIRRADVGVKNTIIGAVLATISFAYGVNYGILGLAYAWLIFYPVFYLICMHNFTKTTKMSFIKYLSSFRYIILNMLCMSLIIYLTQVIYDGFSKTFISPSFAQYARLGCSAFAGFLAFSTFIIVFEKNVYPSILRLIRSGKM